MKCFSNNVARGKNDGWDGGKSSPEEGEVTVSRADERVYKSRGYSIERKRERERKRV